MSVENFFRTWTIKKTKPDPVAQVGGSISFYRCDNGDIRCKTSTDFSPGGDWSGTVFRFDPDAHWLYGWVPFDGTGRVYIIATVTGDEDSGFHIRLRHDADKSPGGDASGDDTGTN